MDKVLTWLNNFSGITVEKPGHHYRGAMLELTFQDGVVSEKGHNGTTNEAVLTVLIDRLNFLQKEHHGGKFSCRENAIVITKLEEALMWLEKRTIDRTKRGVEGTLVV